jgi:hypothetical protein
MREHRLPLDAYRDDPVLIGEIRLVRPSSSEESGRRLPPVTWQKSRRSNPSGNCVELAELPGGGIAIRNSRDPDGPVLIYTLDEIAAFINGARDGDFDNLVT